jgi:hypothetical protein
VTFVTFAYNFRLQRGNYSAYVVAADHDPYFNRDQKMRKKKTAFQPFSSFSLTNLPDYI